MPLRGETPADARAFRWVWFTGAVASRHLTRAGVAMGRRRGGGAPEADRHYKKKHGEPVDLLVLGDSIAAGLGADRAKDTLGSRLARGIASSAGRSVRLRTAAVVGSESSMLAS